jgi:hypothetical protein
MNSGAAGWVAAMAGRTATVSGICGPWGCAQSWGTHTVRHFPKYPEGVQPLKLAGKSGPGAADLTGTDPPEQPAAASTATAASAAHHCSQRREVCSPDAGADRMSAMVNACRTRAVRCGAAAPAPVIGSPASYCSAAGQPGTRAERPVAGPAATSRGLTVGQLGTTVGPHVVHPAGQPTRHRTQRKAHGLTLSRQNA